jgi:Protein of unknown function (DUF2911)
MFKQWTIGLVCTAVLVAVGFSQEPRKSPHETVSVTVGGNNISISYGRPYLRGRKAVGGSLVPYGQVWRTGADEATKLTTDADLMIGNLKVPKGSYALFTVPAKDHWTLVINKTADQWGAFKYDESQDLGRTELKVQQLSSPVEQFTIELTKRSDDQAALTLSWENTKASTRIRAM